MKKVAMWISLLWLVTFGTVACTGIGSDSVDYLIRIDGQIISVQDFNKALEVTKSAYPYSVTHSAEAMRDVRLRVFNQLVEELILTKRAAELHLEVDETELAQAIASIQQDYPDGTFQQTLIENAISFETWKDRLKVRLLMAKVIERDLEGRIDIAPEDIQEYLREGHQGAADSPLQDSSALEETIVKALRKKKAQAQYSAWLNELQQKYRVEINQKKWAELLES